MKKLGIAVLSVAAATLAAGVTIAPQRAGAATAPVVIQYCNIGSPKALSQKVNGLRIGYTNMSHKTASRVQFMVTYRGNTRKVADVGSFAPGKQIVHTFTTFDDTIYGGNAVSKCFVSWVGFLDGATWAP